MRNKIVYLVGSGPGDPGLITVKGLECIKKANVIVYDYLVNYSLLKNARDDAEIIYVGKNIKYPILPRKVWESSVLRY